MSSEEISMLGFFGMMILGTSAWAAYDSWKNRVTSAGSERWYGTEPFTWFVACILVWIIAFPWYLYRRGQKLGEDAYVNRHQKIP